MAEAFNKKTCTQKFQSGDLILKTILPIQEDKRGKQEPNYESSYVAKKVFSGEALILTNMDGDNSLQSINLDSIKMSYA